VGRLRRLLLVEEKSVVALVGGWNGGERGKEKLQKRGQRGWFLADFGLDFLLIQAMKCSPIYRRWKRNILSLMVPNRGLWFGW
jgi:hypothetical protein